MKKTFLCVLFSAVFALIIPLAATGCKKDGKLIRINEVTHSVFYAPLYLADALGYFGEEDIKVELTNGGGADKTMAAVLANEADVGFCGPESVIYTYLGGSNNCPKVFGQLTKRDGSFLVARTQPQGGFDWTSLQGKNIIAGRPGGVPLMTFSYVLNKLNVTANLVTNIDFNLMTAAFKGGTGDYCTMFEPTASEYQAAGNGYIVASVGQQSGEIPYTCFMAKQSYINKHGDKIEGLLRAVTKATKYLNETDSSTVARLLKPYFDVTGEDSLKTSVESYKAIDAWVTNMAMEESAFTKLQDVIELSGQLKSRVAFADVVTTQTAQRVYEQVYA